MDHIALNRSWPNNGDLNHDIIKTFRLHAGERRHLGPAFDLKNTNGIGFLHDLEGRLIICWNMSQIEGTPALPTKLERILHDRHHAEAEQIDFHNAEIF